VRIEFSIVAQSDIDDMARYGIFHWGEQRAFAFLDSFIEDLQILLENPGIGKADGDVRYLNFGNYKVTYEIERDFIYIVGIEPKGATRE